MEKRKAIIGDFLELGANAFASGLVVAIALAAITLALAGAAQAAPASEAEDANPPWSVAPTPTAHGDAVAVGALWATPAPPDASGNVQLLLGLVALSATGLVAVVGRAVSTGRS